MIRKIIALDLDGTLLNSKKELSDYNRKMLFKAVEHGMEIVPTTGRFYGGMPQAIRDLPFIHYCICINGASGVDLETKKVFFKAEIPCEMACDVMSFGDTLPVIYDCYLDNWGWMTEDMLNRCGEYTPNELYKKMIVDLRKPVPELKAFLIENKRDVQKMQYFLKDPSVKEEIIEQLKEKYPELAISTSLPHNIEINIKKANKGEALLALADYLGLKREDTIAFGDGSNDLSMIEMAGIGVAMENAELCVKEAADRLTCHADDDGVGKEIARMIEEFR